MSFLQRKPKFEIEKLPDTKETHDIGYPHVLRITKRGKWNGVKFSFGAVKFKKTDNDCVVNFEYEIIRPTDKELKNALMEDTKFNYYLGDILKSIMETLYTTNNNDKVTSKVIEVVE